jgi:hypothetical protein
MAKYALIICIFFFHSALVLAQAKALTKKMTIHKVQAQVDYYQPTLDTRGILLEWHYSLSPTGKQQMRTTPVHILLRYESGLIYADTSQLIILRCNKQQRASVFIPYRLLDLRGGEFYESGRIKMRLVLPDIMSWECDTLAFEQPQRCQLDIDLSTAAVKERLEAWDKQEMGANALPDPYWAVFLGKSTRPAAVSVPVENSFAFSSEAKTIFLLQSDSIFLRFFDEDGRSDQLLADIALPACTGDATLRRFGEMQGEVKNLNYTLQYQQLTQQPIMLYTQQTEHNGRKGVRIDVDYNVSRNFKGQIGKINFVFLDNDLQPVEMTDVNPIPATHSGEISPALDSFCLLNTRARWSYFIPYHAWNNNIKQIAFYMFTNKGQRATATPCILLRNIVFEQPLRYAHLRVQENMRFQGVVGIGLTFAYSVREDYPDTESLFLSLRYPNGNPVTSIYRLFSPPQQPLLLDAPRKSDYGMVQRFAGDNRRDSMSFFVPYSALEQEELQFSAHLHGEIPLVLQPDTLVRLKLPPLQRDVKLNIVLASDFAVQNDYGKVLQVAYKIPIFLKNRCQIHVAVQRQGQEHQRFRFVNCDTCRNIFTPTQDTGAVEIVLPYRYLSPKDSLHVAVWICYKGNAQKPLSDTLDYHVRLLDDIGTNSFVLEPNRLWLDRNGLPRDTLQASMGWNLSLYVGSQCLFNKPLAPRTRYTSAMLAQFRSEFTAHREDKIRLILTKQDSIRRQVELYKGKFSDLRKTRQRIDIRQKFPIAHIRWYNYTAAIARSPFRRWLYRWGFLGSRK